MVRELCVVCTSLPFLSHPKQEKVEEEAAFHSVSVRKANPTNNTDARDGIAHRALMYIAHCSLRIAHRASLDSKVRCQIRARRDLVVDPNHHDNMDRDALRPCVAGKFYFNSMHQVSVINAYIGTCCPNAVDSALQACNVFSSY